MLDPKVIKTCLITFLAWQGFVSSMVTSVIALMLIVMFTHGGATI